MDNRYAVHRLSAESAVVEAWKYMDFGLRREYPCDSQEIRVVFGGKPVTRDICFLVVYHKTRKIHAEQGLSIAAAPNCQTLMSTMPSDSSLLVYFYSCRRQRICSASCWNDTVEACMP